MPIAHRTRHQTIVCRLENGEQADDDGEESNTFDKCSSDNHRGTNGSGCLRLAGNALHSTLANFADTQTCTYGGKTGSDTCAKHSDEFCCLCRHFK